MRIHSEETAKIHQELHENYRRRLQALEEDDVNDEEQEEPFERSFLHNAILLHNLWFDQLSEPPVENESPLLKEILEQRDSDQNTFEEWMSDFAKQARPNGWAIWGWSYPQKTFVGFPMRGYDSDIPIGITPILVIDCWEHSYIYDFENDFDMYLVKFWRELNWQVIENRHKELSSLMGYDIK